jgi:hypothetical protein
MNNFYLNKFRFHDITLFLFIESDPQMDMGMKHTIIQDVVVNQVYLGGDPPLVEELGFGSGPKGYALMQYVMAYHENDPCKCEVF